MKKIFIALLVLLLLAGCAPAPGTGEFTYRQAVSQVPFCYSPLDWQTEEAGGILELTSSPLYAPAIGDGSYEFLPEMAADVPRDISAGKGKLWQINLRTDALWSDGTPITAQTYFDSMKELLNPGRQHSLAQDYFFLENAWAWYYGDTSGEISYKTLAECGYLSVSEALRSGEAIYIDMNAFWGLDCGWQSIESTESFRDPEIAEGEPGDYVSPSQVYNENLADGAPYAAYQTTFTGVAREPAPKADWADVGISVTGDYQLTLRTARAMTPAELMQKLSRCFLVPESYDASYGMAPEDYRACGPYILESATGEELRFIRNETWYGYADESRAGEYMATAVSWRVLSPEDAQAEFEAGTLDTVTAAQGENTKSIPQTYTSKLTFNTSPAALEKRQSEGINKTILADRDFRKALALSIDRQAFVQECVPSAAATLGLINGTFLTDIAAGERYRDTQPGKQVLETVYGNTAGYDLTEAARLFAQAYDRALAAGTIGETDRVVLEFLSYSDTRVYRDIAAFIQRSVDAGTKGTPLENRVEILLTADEAYYDTAKTGEFEIILSTWGGAEEDPYAILGCYCLGEKLYEYGFDPSREGCTLILEGEELTKSYLAWYEEMSAQEDPARKLKLLAALETAILERYDCTPIYERSTLFADGARILRPVEEAVPFAGFGGVRYLRFLTDDAGNPVEEAN